MTLKSLSHNMVDPIYCSFPKAQVESRRTEIMKAINRVLDGGTYCLGPEVEAFEREFANYHNVSHAVGVGSGTDALILAMRSLGIRPGDEVITVSHTALATVAAIIMTGATPVLVDIEEDYYTLDPLLIEAEITSKTKAIVPVHIYGQPCDMDPILDIARKHNLFVIEDCAQAHAATYKGKKVGTMGDIGCFSFYPTKNLGAIGDGGAIITDDTDLKEKLLKLRQYGWDVDRIAHVPSNVTRLDELQAAILRIKLVDLDADTQKRRDIAAQYNSLLNNKDINHPLVRPDSEHAYHLYVCKLPSEEARDKYIEHLKGRNIFPGIHYTHPAHVHPGYREHLRLAPGGLSRTEDLIKRIVSLPMYPELQPNKYMENINV